MATDLTLLYVALATTLPTSAVALVGLLLKRQGDDNKAQIAEVHVLVDGRMTRVTDLLEQALADNVRLKDNAGEAPGPPATAKEAIARDAATAAAKVVADAVKAEAGPPV